MVSLVVEAWVMGRYRWGRVEIVSQKRQKGPGSLVTSCLAARLLPRLAGNALYLARRGWIASAP